MTSTDKGTDRGTANRRRPWAIEFYGSAVGKKWVMAITGIVFLGYVFVHMLGNLKLYLGTDPTGIYAHRSAFDDCEADEIDIGQKVDFRIRFNRRGPAAVEVHLKSRS